MGNRFLGVYGYRLGSAEFVIELSIVSYVYWDNSLLDLTCTKILAQNDMSKTTNLALLHFINIFKGSSPYKM